MLLNIKENEPLKNHSTFRIGGPARYFVVAKNKEEILEAVDFAKHLSAGRHGKSLPFLVFGGGSNVLFRDEGYEGIVIQILNSKFEILNSGIIASGGLPLSKLVNVATEVGFTGMEWAVGIPGTVGGGVNGNCGAYGKSMSDVVESVEVLLENGEVKKYSKEECGFVYRGSKFKRSSASFVKEAELRASEIILEVTLKLEKGDPEKIKSDIKDILDKRKGKVPTQPSAGSVFKNIKMQSSKIKMDCIIPEEKIKGGKLPVAYLTEECGLKGKQIGGAQISPLHANFIVNIGGAKAQDVLDLIKLCKEKVAEKFGIDLEEEIVIINPR